MYDLILNVLAIIIFLLVYLSIIFFTIYLKNTDNLLISKVDKYEYITISKKYLKFINMPLQIAYYFGIVIFIFIWVLFMILFGLNILTSLSSGNNAFIFCSLFSGLLYLLSSIIIAYKADDLKNKMLSLIYDYYIFIFFMLPIFFLFFNIALTKLMELFFIYLKEIESILLSPDPPLLYVILSGILFFFVSSFYSFLAKLSKQNQLNFKKYFPHIDNLNINIFHNDTKLNFIDDVNFFDENIDKYQYVILLDNKYKYSSKFNVIPLEISFNISSSSDNNYFYNIEPIAYKKLDTINTIRYINKPIKSHSRISFKILLFSPNTDIYDMFQIKIPIAITNHQFYHYKSN